MYTIDDCVSAIKKLNESVELLKREGSLQREILRKQIEINKEAIQDLEEKYKKFTHSLGTSVNSVTDDLKELSEINHTVRANVKIQEDRLNRLEASALQAGSNIERIARISRKRYEAVERISTEDGVGILPIVYPKLVVKNLVAVLRYCLTTHIPGLHLYGDRLYVDFAQPELSKLLPDNLTPSQAKSVFRVMKATTKPAHDEMESIGWNVMPKNGVVICPFKT